MRVSLALVVSALCCTLTSCAGKASAVTTAAPRAVDPSSALMRQADAARSAGQMDRAAMLWERVLAAAPASAIRRRALLGAAEARLAAPPSASNLAAARTHLRTLLIGASDAETRLVASIALQAVDRLTALDGDYRAAIRERDQVKAELVARTEALRKAASTLLEPKKPD